MIHSTYGLYPNGEVKTNGVSSELLAEHIRYNLTMRPGRALFVDGHLISKGIGVSEELLKIHGEKAKALKATKDTQPYH